MSRVDSKAENERLSLIAKVGAKPPARPASLRENEQFTTH